jgi:hypothetical protein
MSTPGLVPVGQVGSQQVQQKPQTIYLRQTDPNFTQPLPSKFGGLDNGYYATGDVLLHNGATFVRTPVSSTGAVLLSDPAQKTGARWSQRLNTTIASANQYINGLATIQNLMTTAQNDLADVQAGVAQVTLDKQQLVTNFTNLDLYVGGQQSQITQTDAIVSGTNLNIQNELTAIANIYSNISTLQANISSVAGVRDAITAELAGYNTVLTDTQTQLANLTGSDLGATNRLINGDFTVWQRGTAWSGTAASAPSQYLTADRWFHSTTQGGTLSSAKVTATLPAAGLYNGSQTVNALQVAVAGNSSAFRLCTAIEESIQQTCTISVWMRASSACTIACTVKQQSSANAVVSYGPTNFSVTTTWTRFSATFALTPQTNGQLTILQFSGSSWPTVQLAKAQLQMGSTALEFEERNIQVDLMLCRRYYESGYDYFADYADAYSYVSIFHNYAVEKRVTPTLTLSSQGSPQGFLDPVSVGSVNNTFMGSSMRQKNNRNENGVFQTNWVADAEIYGL